MRNWKRNSDGFTLITTLLLLFLLSGLAIGMLMMVNTEVKVGTQDVQNNTTFHAAESGIEKMTSDLADLLRNNLAPSTTDITTLATAPGPPVIPGITFPAGSYTLNPVLNAAGTAPAYTTGTVPSGNYAGLTATLMNVNLNATAQGPLGDEVNMARTVEVAFIPVFQFGVFSDLDLSFFSSPDIDFDGRVHTNGDLYLGCGGGNTCTFHQKITAYGNVVRSVLPNGLAAATYNDTGTVQVPKSPGGCDTGLPNCQNLPTAGNLWGSLTGAGGNPPASAYNSGAPSWKTISLTNLGGMMIDGDYNLAPNVPANSAATGATALTLPFVQGVSAFFGGPGLGNPPGPQAFEIIRRPPVGEATTTPLGASRLYNEAAIRVLLSDRPDELPGGAGDPDNVRLANLASNQGNGNDFSRGVPVRLPAGLGLPALPGGSVYTTYFATASTAIPNPSQTGTTTAICGVGDTYCFYSDWPYAPGAPTVANEYVNDGNVPRSTVAISNSGTIQAPAALQVQSTYPYYAGPTLNSNAAGDTQWNLIDGYLRVEYLPQNGACPGPGATINGYCAITREWLQFGFARGSVTPNAAGVPFTANSNQINPYAILIFQQPAMRVTSGATIWPNPPALDQTGTVPGGCTAGLKCTSGKPPEIPYDNVLNGQNAAWKYSFYSDCTGTLNVGSYCTAGVVSRTAFNWYPINFYDGREGEPSDTVQGNNTCTPLGVMNAVELDVGNLKQWLLGNIPGSGTLVNNTNQNGYVLYFSDRRGMLPNPNGTQTIAGGNNPLTNISGDAGFEDVVNRGSNTRVPDGALEAIAANKLVSAEDNNLNGLLDNFGSKNLGLGMGYIPTAANPAPGTAYNAATSVNAKVNSNPPNPYLANGTRMQCAVLNTSMPQKNWVSGARHVLKLVDGSLGNVPTIPGGAFPTSSGGFTVGSENPVYVQGNYNTNCGAVGQVGCTPGNANYDLSWPPPIGNNGADPVHSAAAIIADTVVMLSNSWLDWNTFFGNQGANSPPTNPQNNNRNAIDTLYRTAIAAGRVQDFDFPGWANATTYYTGTDGGVHNFLQFREDWGQGADDLYYKGSMVNLFLSTYNTGIMKCCAYSVYTPPSRHYSFDDAFTVPQQLPPGTPTFRDIDNLSYRQSFTACNVGANGVCTN